jgi:tetratricopeptide (TPR) repeat protein
VKNAAIAALLLALCLGAARAAEEAAPKSGWDAFDLRTRVVDGITVHYEVALEPAMDDVEKLLRAELEKTAALANGSLDPDRLHEAAAEICRFTGTPEDDSHAASAATAVGQVLRNWPLRGLLAGEGGELYIARGDSIKAFLRDGGSLPRFTYDRATDTVMLTYSYFVPVGSPDSAAPPDTPPALPGVGRIDSATPPDTPLALPVKGSDTAVDEIEKLLRVGSPVAYFGASFHEMAEVAIVRRLEYRDPHLRWFGEGFANVISLRLLEKFFGTEFADEFAAGYDPSDYADIENTVNLEFWLTASLCVKTPLDSEDDLSNARYAYATLEAKRLADEHGIECLKAILDRCAEKAPVDSAGLFDAIREVTGEDLKERFARYRTFDTAEEGIAMYAARVNEASERGDYAAMLPDVLRALELRDGYDVNFYRNIAVILAKMGEEDYADRMYQSQLATLRKPEARPAYILLAVGFINHALACGRAAVVHDVAEEVLAVDGNYVPALLVRLHRLIHERNREEATETARRIIELDPSPDSPFHSRAADFLEKADKVFGPEPRAPEPADHGGDGGEDE